MLSKPEDPKPEKRRYFSNKELLDRFKVYMRKKNLSIPSLSRRETAARKFLCFMEQIGLKTIYKLNTDTLKRYLQYLKENNFTAESQRLMLKSLKGFYNWLLEDGIIEGKNDIFEGFCVYAYIKELKKTYKPVKITIESEIRKEVVFYMDKFLAYYLNKGYSKTGTDIYKRELLYEFIPYLEDKTNITSLKDVTKKILAEYQLSLSDKVNRKGNPYSVSTKQKRLVVVKRFFKFLVQHDYLEKDPSTIIELPRLERGIPTQIMTERELETYLKAPDITGPRGLRDRAIMEVLYSTGMRNNELCHLKVSDVDLNDGLVKITHAKGGIGFQRVVPIGKTACLYVDKYLKEARPALLQMSKKADEGDLFFNNFGTRLLKNTLSKIMLEYRVKTNTRSKITAHSFRVTCATQMLKNGADVRYIQEQLGHRSLRSTQIYTRVFPKDLKKVHSMTHPREKATKV